MKTNLWMILASFLIVGSTSYADGPRARTAPPPPQQGPVAPGQPPPQEYIDDDGCYESGCDDAVDGYGLEIESYYDRALPIYDPFLYYYCDFDIYSPCDQIVWVDGYPRFPYPRVITPYFNLQRWYGAWGPQLRRLPYYGGGHWGAGYARGGYVEGGGYRGGFVRGSGFPPPVRPGFVGGGGGFRGPVGVPRGFGGGGFRGGFRR